MKTKKTEEDRNKPGAKEDENKSRLFYETEKTMSKSTTVCETTKNTSQMKPEQILENNKHFI